MRIEITGGHIHKLSDTLNDRLRLQHEERILRTLRNSPHTPSVVEVHQDKENVTLIMEYITGESAQQWLNMERNWLAKSNSWKNMRVRLGQYIAAETDLLKRDVLYRDLNLNHVIFTNEKAVLIDHEEAIMKSPIDLTWHLDSHRGTWETMALEEFSGHAELTARTATYRSAVIAHIVLTGCLPFPRFPLRSLVYKWRKNHPPHISPHLSKSTRQVFAAALSRKPERRYKDPASFLDALSKQYEL